jgi:hypothetical protein
MQRPVYGRHPRRVPRRARALTPQRRLHDRRRGWGRHAARRRLRQQPWPPPPLPLSDAGTLAGTWMRAWMGMQGAQQRLQRPCHGQPSAERGTPGTGINGRHAAVLRAVSARGKEHSGAPSCSRHITPQGGEARMRVFVSPISAHFASETVDRPRTAAVRKRGRRPPGPAHGRQLSHRGVCRGSRCGKWPRARVLSQASDVATSGFSTHLASLSCC